jgi:hypothetical protein
VVDPVHALIEEPSMKLSRWLSLLMLAVLIASCSSLPTQPSRFARYGVGLEMSITLSSEHGDPSHPITVRTRVVNTGRPTVYYGESCSTPALFVAVHAPDRANIIDPCVECPGTPCPLYPPCLGRTVALRSGESVERTFAFDGTLLSCAGLYRGQAGVYAVEATLPARLEDGRDVTASRATSFEWSTLAPR